MSETRAEPDPARTVAAVFATVAFAGALAAGPATNVWLATAIGGALALVGVVVVDARQLLARLRFEARAVVVGVLGAAALTTATYVAYPFAVQLVPWLGPEVTALYALLEAPPGPRAAYPVLLGVVVVEELVWRGLIYDMLEQRMRPAIAVPVATALYAIPQVATGSWVLVAVALGCGSIWTAQRARTGSLVAPLITHALWSSAVFAVVPLGELF